MLRTFLSLCAFQCLLCLRSCSLGPWYSYNVDHLFIIIFLGKMHGWELLAWQFKCLVALCLHDFLLLSCLVTKPCWPLLSMCWYNSCCLIYQWVPSRCCSIQRIVTASPIIWIQGSDTEWKWKIIKTLTWGESYHFFVSLSYGCSSLTKFGITLILNS